jgi:hypothetical protein
LLESFCLLLEVLCLLLEVLRCQSFAAGWNHPLAHRCLRRF